MKHILLVLTVLIVTGLAYTPSTTSAYSQGEESFFEVSSCFIQSVFLGEPCIYSINTIEEGNVYTASVNQGGVGFFESISCTIKTLFGGSCVEEVPQIAEEPEPSPIQIYNLAEDPKFLSLRTAYEDLRDAVNTSQPAPIKLVTREIVKESQQPNIVINPIVRNQAYTLADITPSLDCSVYGSGGKLTTNAEGVIICANDNNSRGGSNSNTDAQELSYNTGTYILSIGGGNNVDLSSISTASSTLEDLNDVASFTQSTGEVLQWNGTAWTSVATSTLGLGGSSGTVSSIALSAPTGLTVSGSPITASGTLALSLTAGYNIPLTASTTNWNTAYNTYVSTTTGDWLGTLDGQEGSYYLDLTNSSGTTDNLTEGVSNLFWTNSRFDTRLSATTTDALTEGSTNQYFTNARVSSYITGSSTISKLGQTITESELNINTPTSAYILAASSTATGGWEWVATSTSWLGLSSGGGSSLLTDAGATTYLTSLTDNLSIGTTTSPGSSRLTIQSTGTSDIFNLFETGGTEVFTVLESGNVGIGTASPTGLLQIQVPAFTDRDTDSQQVIISNSGDDNYGIRMGFTGSSGYGVINVLNPSVIWGDLILQDGGGNVGIGTTTPSQKLHVIGNGLFSGTLTSSSFSGAGTGLTGTASSLTAGNVTTNANLTGAVTSVGNATSLGSFTSANLSTALTNETGTGSAVFSASPTFTGTVNAAAANLSGSLTVTGSIVSSGGTIRDSGGGWVRTYGATGWYNGTYGGGWYMNDSSAVKAYGDKNIYTGGLLQIAGTGNSYISGNVGIGLTTPTKGKLEVSGSQNATLASFGWLNSVGYTGYQSTSQSPPYSIYASSRIASLEFNAFSDARIKNIVGVSDSSTDLEIIKNIEITDYTYRDISRGNQVIKKVIGQQVEGIFPQAVSVITDKIPDIFRTGTIVNGVVTLSGHGLLKGERVAVAFEEGNTDVLIFEIQSVTQNSFTIESNKSGEVFVYGREVDDFRVVDYQALAMLNISATQEIAKQVDSLSYLSYLSIDENGNIGVGTTTPNYKLQIVGDVAANGFVNISMRDSKRNIKYLTQAEEDSILDKILNLAAATYYYNSDSATTTEKRLGLIAEDSPAEILSEGGRGIDMYKFVTFLSSGIKSLANKVFGNSEKIATLEQEVSELKVQLSSVVAVDNFTNPNSTTVTYDTKTPTITLIGNNPSNIAVDTNYNDLGATAQDSAGNDINITVFVDGIEVDVVDLDTSTSTTYTIIYEATDNDQTVSTTREVVIRSSRPEAQTATTSEQEILEDNTATITETNKEIDDTNTGSEYPEGTSGYSDPTNTTTPKDTPETEPYITEPEIEVTPPEPDTTSSEATLDSELPAPNPTP